MSYEGKVVLNYRLTKKLGEGGFGAVYLAEQVDLGRRAAIKILHHQFASQPQVVERFFREARAVCDIGHRAIVAIENFGKLPETDEPFYLMEFFPGGSLTQITSERWLTSEQLVAILDPIADALTHAHAKQIIHRDLKPDNIMVRIANDQVADVRLLDFGIAKLLDGSSHSVTGATMGTPSYMPPEQALDAKNVDVRADVYAFGATVFAAVSGRPPFVGDSVAAILLAVQQQTAPLMATLRPDVPPDLDAAIRRCLAKQREHRPASIADAWSAIRAELVRANLTAAPAQLHPAAAAHTPRPMRPGTPLPVPSPQETPAAPSVAATSPEVRPKSKLPLVLGIAGVAVAGTAIAIVVARSSDGAKSETPVATVDAAVVVAVDAAPVAVDAAPVRQPLDRDRVLETLAHEVGKIATSCRNNQPVPPKAPMKKLTFHIEIDPEGVAKWVGLDGTAKVASCMTAAIKDKKLVGPSTTGGNFTVELQVPDDVIAAKPNPKPDPKPDPKLDPKQPEPKPAPACSVSVLEGIAKSTASTEDDLRRALSLLNQCRDQGKIAQTDWQRIQSMIVTRL